MVNDDQYTPVKLRNEIIAEIDRIKEKNPFLRTRPDVLKYVLHRYIEDKDKDFDNGGNGGGIPASQFLTENNSPKQGKSEMDGEERSLHSQKNPSTSVKKQ